ncbi:Maf family protein [Beggiatoa leptomitoformis]|uniref:dTTP/UTP pyrophosphatase n=1 Tax=Beggiatoa leptomitoformis TaxID=288004 RepID=A0A2N9YD53_9GAMM|nr:Maf family protein [Beggiatoa leptomitoformis]ALG69184.1 septum formation inhibitor Maf [Beggiatoa leptomitoformis]AUI68390.1 septum formation inhibitor Maf [Beggiatoa leptomitoformis]
MIYLASQSPRRCELLAQIHVDFQQISVDVDETPLLYEAPAHYVSRLALTKARCGYAQSQAVYPVLGADTSVICDGVIFGKPCDDADAKRMLQQLAGKTHEVMTGIAVVSALGEQVLVNYNQVTFRPLSELEIDCYIATGEPTDKAGAYAVQGLASIFITQIMGSYSGIMGLPLHETAVLLQQARVPLWITKTFK